MEKYDIPLVFAIMAVNRGIALSVMPEYDEINKLINERTNQ